MQPESALKRAVSGKFFCIVNYGRFYVRKKQLVGGKEYFTIRIAIWAHACSVQRYSTMKRLRRGRYWSKVRNTYCMHTYISTCSPVPCTSGRVCPLIEPIEVSKKIDSTNDVTYVVCIYVIFIMNTEHLFISYMSYWSSTLQCLLRPQTLQHSLP
jgi:hypothetical protein